MVWGCKKKTVDDVKPNDSNTTVNIYPTSIETIYAQQNLKEKNDFIFVRNKISKSTSYVDSGNTGYQKEFENHFKYDSEDRVIEFASNGVSGKYLKALVYSYSYENGKLSRFITIEETGENDIIYGDSVWYNYNNQGELKYLISKFYILNASSYSNSFDSVSINKQNNDDNLILDLETFTYDLGAKSYKKSQDIDNKAFVFNKINKSFAFLNVGGFHEIKYSKVKDILKDFNFIPLTYDSGIINPILASLNMENIESSFISTYTPTTLQTQNEIIVDTYGRVKKIIRWESKPDGSKDKIISTTTYYY